MNSIEFPVYPNIKKIVTICKATIQILEIKMFESVRVAVYLFDSNNSLIESKQYNIEGQEYTEWTDDAYLVKLIKQKIQQSYIV